MIGAPLKTLNRELIVFHFSPSPFCLIWCTPVGLTVTSCQRRSVDIKLAWEKHKHHLHSLSARLTLCGSEFVQVRGEKDWRRVVGWLDHLDSNGFFMVVAEFCISWWPQSQLVMMGCVFRESSYLLEDMKRNSWKGWTWLQDILDETTIDCCTAACVTHPRWILPFLLDLI